MTRNTNARVAGFTFLFYIAAGITSLVVSGKATAGAGVAAKLANIAQHTGLIRVSVALTVLTSFSAIILGVTLWSITRDEDRDLAMLALVFRIIEAVNGIISVPHTLGLVSLATASGNSTPDPAAAQVLGAYLLNGGNPLGALFFAVASTIFSYLLLRGRMIPVALAWLGVIASVIVVIGIPALFAESAGSFSGVIGWAMWMPLLVFEVGIAFWFMIKGVAAPRRS